MIDILKRVILAEILLTLAGCSTPSPSSAPSYGMVRPDGSIVPDPTYESNVVPWIWSNTNGVTP